MLPMVAQAAAETYCCACCSLPFDFVKTRIQKMEKGPDGTYPYKGPVDCAMQTFRKEGPLKFYTGFPTYCIRCARTLAQDCPSNFMLQMRWAQHFKCFIWLHGAVWRPASRICLAVNSSVSSTSVGSWQLPCMSA